MRDIIQSAKKIHKQRLSKEWEYKNLAQQASRLEQEDNHTEAAKIWSKAIDKAPTKKQKDWCDYRVKYCERTAEVKKLVEKDSEQG
ncbi:ANR family transcriptional regulator [Phocoenobacter skyensis]|uniref:ANR family transcriptional regulator n=1 Tax=Phocoenobacter skyensis TaxID=97481 RepID=A0A1H7XM43_9PAST|nr:ANR family transcriptional regulator [Pasteurella skyensis]MDP8184360.1 ANR family transcriptional regulator [Pasteurella skyensis]QLB22632.1 hypothetical protein A6B44_05190 [Pasteurella skyensis]SEM34713.1 hypothetical protein SAMN05444853_11333 [Pasteurella skyensis]